MANLEDMFKKATASQEKTDVAKEEEKVKEETSSEAEAKAQKDEVERLLAEANATEDERKKALDLKKKAEELIKDKTEISPEMQEFLKSADDVARVHADKIKELNERIKDASSDPAVMDMIRAEAEEFNQKRDLNKRYYSVKREIESNLYNYNTVNGKKYHEMIGGHHNGDDPQALLEMYGSMATGDWAKEKASLEDARESVEILERINAESNNPNPDMQKIDGEYANFLYKRLQHFAKTFDQRIEEAATALQEFSQNANDQYKNLTLEDWKKKLTSNKVLDVKYELQNADGVMKENGFKARKLASIGEKIKGLAFISGVMENNAFWVDKFKEK